MKTTDRQTTPQRKERAHFRPALCRLPSCRVLVLTPRATVRFGNVVPRVLRVILADTVSTCFRRGRRNCDRLRERVLLVDSEMRELVATRVLRNERLREREPVDCAASSPGRGLSPLQCFPFRVSFACICAQVDR